MKTRASHDFPRMVRHDVRRKEMKTKLAILLLAIIVIGVGVTVVVGLSVTRDYYACALCKSLGEARGLHVFRMRIPLTPVRRTQSLTDAKCDHTWRWYFANSKGFLLNRENWDGPLGDYPWQEWQEEQANQPSEGTH